MKDKSSTQLRKEIYLRNVARRWKFELNTDKKVYILSPYITSKAENLLENTNVENCEIYTDFTIENFLFGGSSITTLKNLIKKGFKVYDLPQLHAKIILVTDAFVSIGSQNLTNKGTRNKEATFTSTSLKVVKFIENELIKWLNDSKEISLEKIEDLEKQIRPLKKKYKELKKDLERTKEFIEKQEEKRNSERQRKVKSVKRLQRLKTNLSEFEKIQIGISGTVDIKDSYSFSSWYNSWYLSSYVMTFVPKGKNPDLLNWNLGADKFALIKNYRYLALIKNTGKLSWVKAQKTRLTSYGKGVSLSNRIVLSSRTKRWYSISRNGKN